MKDYTVQPNGLLIALLTFSIVMIDGCSSGKRALKRGNYYQSVLTSTDRLRRNDDHKKSRQTLKQAYPLAINYYDSEIENLQLRNDRDKWKGILNAYGRVNNMYEEIRRSPGALRVIPNPINYYSELDEARNNAAEESYQFGLLELDTKTRDGAKNAFFAFKEADGYVKGYKDVVQKIEDSYWRATIKVLVEPIPVAYSKVNLNAMFFEDKIHENLKSNPVNQFVRFMTENELEEVGFPADHILELSFDEFSVGQVHTRERQIQQTKDSVVVATLKSDFQGGRTQTTQPQPDTPREDKTPTSEKEDTTPVQTDPVIYMEICHKLDNGSFQTIMIRESDLAGHMRHGDKIDACTETIVNTGNSGNDNGNQSESTETGTQNEAAPAEEDTNTTAETDTNVNETDAEEEENPTQVEQQAPQDEQQTPQDNQDETQNDQGEANPQNDGNDNSPSDEKENDSKVTVCHKTGSGKFVTLTINRSALQAHLNHGDKQGSCAETTEEDRKDVEKENDKVVVCHKAGKGKYVTLTINRSALAAHIGHGDKTGACEETKPKDDKKGKDNGDKEDKEGKKNKDDKGDEKDGSSDKKPGKANEPLKGNDRAEIFQPGYQPVLTASADGRIYSLKLIESDTSDIDVYGTVKATVYIFEKNLVSNGILSMRILDASTGSVLSADKIQSEYVWTSQWGYFNGDERALTDEHKRIVKQKELPPPTDEELFYGFTEPIMNQLIIRIRDYYRNY